MGMMEQTMAGEVVEGEIFIPFMLNPAAMEVAEPLDLSPSLGSKKRVKNAPISMRQHPDFNEHIVPNYRRSIP